MSLSLLQFINILSTGIVIAISFTIFLLGSKVLSTRFNALFWLVLSAYLLFSLLESHYILKTFRFSTYIHLFIPSMYGLFLLVVRYEKFYYKFILLQIIPIISIFFHTIELFAPVYHLIFWVILIIFTFTIKEKNDFFTKDHNHKRIIIISAVLIGLAVFPFVIYNIINILLFKKIFVIDSMLPPCIAATSILGLISAYNNNLVILNYDYYMNLDHLKKSSAYEKKTIIEKISASLIHEIKNPVTAIQSLNQQLKIKLNKLSEDKIEKYLTAISNDLDKIKSMSESFLKACKRDIKDERTILNLKELLNDIHELLKFELNKKKINLIIDESTVSKSIYFNAYKFRQIMINLIYNSIEADAKNIIIYSKKEKNQIKIYIEDDGIGMTKKDKEKIFTPFYTTKLDGTGMGLSICREILHEEYGNIEALDTPGKTTFLITISKEGNTK